MRLGARFLLAAMASYVLLSRLTAGSVACTIDSIPSATASGRTAMAYDVATSAVNPAHYAPFVFPGSFGAGWTIRFGELSTGLKLTAAQLHAPWSWSFGDGTTGWGHTVTHAFRAPGAYVVTTQAHVPGEQYPFPFDRILIRVMSPGQILTTEGANLLHGTRLGNGSALLGGLLPLRRAADRGLIAIAGQILGQIDSGAWASIKDYWQHTRGSLPPAYTRIDDLLHREDDALGAGDVSRAAAIADQLPEAWTRTAPVPTAIPRPPIASGAVALLLALCLVAGLRGRLKPARRERLRSA